MELNNSSSTSTVLLALLGGAVVGAGLALLYAPQSGRRTRQKLRELAEDAGDYAHDLADKAESRMRKAGQQGEERLHQGQDFVDEKRRQVNAAVEAAKH